MLDFLSDHRTWLGAMALLIVALGWHWLVRHEADLKLRWKAFLQHPPVAEFRR